MTTVKNERVLLRANLLYHHAIGVDAAFVFLDGSTDGTAETICDLPWVVVSPSATAGDMPPALRETRRGRQMLQQLEQHHTARQMLNAVVALERARAAGCEWLISLDPDELVCTEPDAMAGDGLKGFFSGVAPCVEAIQFMTLEVVPRLGTTAAGRLPFAEATLFLNRFRRRRRLFRGGYAFRRGHFFPRPLYDPVHDVVRQVDDYLGQVGGKTAVRACVEAIPASVHGFQRARGGRLVTAQAGWLLHYCDATFAGFLTRVRHRQGMPATYVTGGAVHWWQQLWQGMVNSGPFSEEQLRAYYERYLVPSAAQIEAWRRRAPESVCEVHAVRRFFAAQGR